MAATISINFANEQEVYLEYPPEKKSVSAKLLADVLGGGVVSGGYVKKTGDSMTGYLTLTSRPPVERFHAASKEYVDEHSYTRRYYYECKNTNQIGCFKPGTRTLSGLDLYTNNLKFFEKGTGSLNNIAKYMDVYRNGILQVYGQDYTIVNASTMFTSNTAIVFEEPFQNGSTFQVSIGNVGAFPVTFGVSNVYGSEYGGFGIRTSATSGDVTLFVTTTSFAATNDEVSQGLRHDAFLTPRNLSAAPLANKAWGTFRKDTNWDRSAGDDPDLNPYGNAQGMFFPVLSSNIHYVRNIGAFENPPSMAKFRTYIKNNVLSSPDYVVQITPSTVDYTDAFDGVLVNVIGSSRSLTAFDFYVFDILGANPVDIYEFNITIS